MNEKISIFDIPHIADLIALHLPLKDKANCTLVSKAFHCQFNPALWRDIRKQNRQSQKASQLMYCPAQQQILVTNGHRIRKLSITETRTCAIIQFLAGPLFPYGNLEEFDYTYDHPATDYTLYIKVFEILKKNTYLKKLSISGLYTILPAIFTHTFQVLSSHASLTTLALLDTTKVHRRVYQALLHHLPSTLESLYLRWGISELADPGNFPDSEWREQYPRLRSFSLLLRLRGCQDTTIIPFLRRCPNLEKLWLTQGTVDNVIHDIALLIEETPVLPKLSHLSLRSVGVQKDDWMRVVSGVTGRLKSLSMLLLYIDPASLPFEAIAASWANKLEIIRIQQISVSGHHIELILTTCHKLKTFSVAASQNNDVDPHYSDEVGLSVWHQNREYNPGDWVCLELENLELPIVNARVVYDGNAMRSRSPLQQSHIWEEWTVQEIQNVYHQLGRLTKLQHLRLEWWTAKKYEPCASIDMSIESGLEHLEGLRDLRVLDVSCIQRVNIQQKEVEWIADNWPRIRKIKGLLEKDDATHNHHLRPEDYKFEEMYYDEAEPVEIPDAWVPDHIQWLRQQRPHLVIT
ncbi:hypothetical protein BGX21_006253 [Mortierella sp. AD011]|nr:hypothetical protein BGX21_006253 [Mortierella sp. AD011]